MHLAKLRAIPILVPTLERSVLLTKTLPEHMTLALNLPQPGTMVEKDENAERSCCIIFDDCGIKHRTFRCVLGS